MSEEFLGYSRSNGQVGIRNKIAVISSVVCVNSVARRVAEKIDNAVAITHPAGCGQFGRDFIYTFRTLTGLANNPNVYGVIVIGLGCENLLSSNLANSIKKSQQPVVFFDVQDVQGGTISAIEKGTQLCKNLAASAQEVKREYFDFSNLTLGLECGGSDSISGITANPAVGVVSDKIVNLGGTSILPEFTEWIGTEHLLVKRAVNEEVAKKIKVPLKEFLDRANESGFDFLGVQPTPGNIAGGLSTIEEKSLGTISKGGKAKIQGVLQYSEKPNGKGLWLMVEPGLDIISVTGLAAAGAQVIIMTTGRGTPLGNPVVPVIKICGNPKTCDWMANNIDVNASLIITECSKIDDIATLLWEKLKKTCNGEPTIAEILGFEEDIAVWRSGGLI
ncbi:MAG: UxaA family hydrolase [Candidatus Heimdallarchaeota archaeon]